MATLRELKERIGSVASTQKTTSAMKMISSAKLHGASARLVRLSPYRGMVQGVIGHLLATGEEFSSPLIESREVKRLCIVAFGSDDGLCGAFNINIFKRLLDIIDQERQSLGNGVEITVIPVGKKLSKAAHKIESATLRVEDVPYMHTRSNSASLHDFTQLLRERFTQRECDRVDLVYMHFHSTSRQTLAHEQLLPLSAAALAGSAPKGSDSAPCIFEPDANSIFNSVLPLHLRATMQEVFTESAASEQAARVMAMQTASDNAKDLLDSLNLEYNKLRQQGITTELLDILGGQVER
ncbi:MAG: ATP synthase F1 subunit gamma [Bacteroidales bacterium]|nr:ATP synthase F1 subunit gamma [Bacteroidales bacterium]MDY3912432.1 ATP synthase F1 subunit gamma [Sodaliphilus sp.]